jgi:hypothetical protein
MDAQELAQAAKTYFTSASEAAGKIPVLVGPDTANPQSHSPDALMVESILDSAEIRRSVTVNANKRKEGSNGKS